LRPIRYRRFSRSRGWNPKVHNGRLSRWDHGQVRQYITYKAQAEGIAVRLIKEHHTSQTCPRCSHRHKPQGRSSCCPACGFQAHRDIVGQINILSRFKEGEVGKLPAPSVVKYRIPHHLRVLRRCRDTGLAAMPVARGQPREATAL
jgi:putative transposase